MTARRLYIGQAMPSRDPNGRALPAKLKFFDPTGTYDTLKAVYTNSALLTAHAQPVLSDSAGRFPEVWADAAETFDVVWYDQTFGRQLDAWTNITPLSDAMTASAADADAAADAAAASAAAAAATLADVEAISEEFTDLGAAVASAEAAATAAAASADAAAASADAAALFDPSSYFTRTQTTALAVAFAIAL